MYNIVHTRKKINPQNELLVLISCFDRLLMKFTVLDKLWLQTFD